MVLLFNLGEEDFGGKLPLLEKLPSDQVADKTSQQRRQDRSTRLGEDLPSGHYRD